jgi:protein-disulfide isomerase
LPPAVDDPDARPLETTMRLSTLFAAPILALMTAAPVLAASESKPDRAEIEAIVRDYLVKNPEVIEEAINELQARRAKAEADRQKSALSENTEEIMSAPQNVVLGNPSGDVTLVEFFDYNCGYCKRGLADVLALMEKDRNLKVILKDYPILSPGSIEAAAVALAVKKQLQGEKFLEFHKTLLLTRGQVGKERAMQVAKDNGVDMAKLEADLAGQTVRTNIGENLRLGEALGISGTPSYVLASEVVGGAVGYEALKGKIDAIRKCGQTTC